MSLEAGLERRRAVDLSRHEHGAVEQERGLPFLDDLEAGARQGGAAGRGQLGRVESRNRDAAATPEVGVDQYRKIASSELLRESLHPGDVVPVTVAQDNCLDVSRQDLQPAHVLGHSGRRHTCVE